MYNNDYPLLYLYVSCFLFPTGEKQVSGNWKEEKNNWICPHVYGGIPLDCVEKVYKMVRDGPKFLSIEGVTFKLFPGP